MTKLLRPLEMNENEGYIYYMILMNQYNNQSIYMSKKLNNICQRINIDNVDVDVDGDGDGDCGGGGDGGGGDRPFEVPFLEAGSLGG